MERYKRISIGLKNYNLYPYNYDIFNLVEKFPDADLYESLYTYEKEHYLQFKKNKSVAGITGITTSRIVFDFDSGEDVEKAREDTKTLAARLMQKYGLNQDDFRVFFSGSKGFHLEIKTSEKFSRVEIETILKHVGSGLTTLDTKIVDEQRIIRVPLTKHPKTGLYKIPLDIKQLTEWSIDIIKEEAKNTVPDDIEYVKEWKEVALTEEFLALRDLTPEEVEKKESGIKFDDRLELYRKPSWMSSTKFALQEGFFRGGERNEAFMILAATYKSQGYPPEISWRMLKGVAELQAKRNDSDEYSEEELWNNIIKVVHGPHWKGGTYSEKETGLLKTTAERFDINEGPKPIEDIPRTISDVTDKFKHYVNNIEKNTIKTGIKSLDKGLFLSTGANVAILGAPGSGKSSIALEILRNTSLSGIKSVFASLDMASTRIYEKILYKLTGSDRDTIYDIYKNDEEGHLVKQMDKNFGNVFFYDRSQPTVEDLRKYILDCEKTSGEKIKMVMIDYFERLYCDIADSTAASKKVAGDLQDLVNDLDICLITLVQPNKMSGDMSKPIHSYTNIKGSSFLAQSFRIILGIYREGYSSTNNETDRFLTVNVLKNDLGEPASFDFVWNGKRGEIYEMDSFERAAIKKFRDDNKEEAESRRNYF